MCEINTFENYKSFEPVEVQSHRDLRVCAKTRIGISNIGISKLKTRRIRQTAEMASVTRLYVNGFPISSIV